MRLLPLFALLALSAPALAQEAPASADQSAQPEKPKKEKKDKNDPNRQICRRIASSSSRLGGSQECHTKAEWAERDGDTQGRYVKQNDPSIRSN
jgi:hypothetical protein